MDKPMISVPAKINLHLQVIGRRQDGFHQIRTLLQSVDVRDGLSAEVEPEGDVHLEVSPAGSVPVGAQNLVLMAALALRRETGCKLGTRIRLFKRIPVGAGLGGGSADAAATLVLLDRLWELGLDAKVLQGLAAQLGSDVPFFLYGGLGLGVGRGEEVYPLPDLPQLGVLLVKPKEDASTARVYSGLSDQSGSISPDEKVPGFWFEDGDRVRWGDLVNDLEEATIALCPEVGAIRERLRQLEPLRAGVTGSGSAVFAVFPDFATAKKAKDRLEVDPSWWVHVCRTLTREEARP
ncbi:MAG: 4-(cytidine 5'-diphospho)-2-C-methyl-D-erythritol kinase [bacterium]|nr:4-(cytidine 5'-diphospho)-2-C-methyl-D-erythritol kinase [bacterium]